jgi:hypothetical protein
MKQTNRKKKTASVRSKTPKKRPPPWAEAKSSEMILWDTAWGILASYTRVAANDLHDVSWRSMCRRRDMESIEAAIRGIEDVITDWTNPADSRRANARWALLQFAEWFDLYPNCPNHKQTSVTNMVKGIGDALSYLIQERAKQDP